MTWSPEKTAYMHSLANRVLLGFVPPPEPAPADVTRSAIRNRRVRQATPKWADLTAIAEFYKEARWMSLRTKRKHHVDHIVPIEGGTVCGLHVENNLRVLPAVENVRRARKWIA